MFLGLMFLTKPYIFAKKVNTGEIKLQVNYTRVCHMENLYK